jgi:N-acetylmuramoyl-L-alanine amidase
MRYRVKQGDCFASIAAEHGLFWQTLWNHPENSELRAQREDPNILYPGDVVFVPEKESKIETGATGVRHRFRRKGIPEFLSLRFLHQNEPRAGEAYMLTIDGKQSSGQLDADGACVVPIPPGSKTGSLLLGDPSNGEEYQLYLGHMDPVEETSGVQARLYNLGYLTEEPSYRQSPELAGAIKAFQLEHGLATEQGLDEATRTRLVEVHGS